MPHEALEIKLRFCTFAHARSSNINEALEIISELIQLILIHHFH